MPGVVVSTSVRSGPSGSAVLPISTMFVVGLSERGPLDEPTLVTSLAQFEADYGAYTATGWLHPTIQTFFEEGGARAYVQRVLGASSAASSVTLDDASSDATITLDAANAGAWGNDLDATVATSGSNFSITILYNGTQVYTTGLVATAADAVAAINASTTAGRYVVATDEGASNLDPAAGTFSLTGGSNGSSATATTYTTGLDLLTTDLGGGVVCIPGVDLTAAVGSDTAGEVLINHAAANNRIAIGSFPVASTVSDVETDAPTITDETDAQHLALYWPWVTVTTDAGALTIPPDGFVAAKRSISLNKFGPWQAFAGSVSKASFVTGLETAVSAQDASDVDAVAVNALRIISGSVRIYGARAAADDAENWRYITFRDTLNYFTLEAEAALEDLIFSPIDSRRALFNRIESRLVALLEPIRLAGGLFERYDANGNLLDPGYSVVVSDANNPASQLAEGLIIAEVGMRLSSVGDQIQLTITKSNLTSTVV